MKSAFFFGAVCLVVGLATGSIFAASAPAPAPVVVSAASVPVAGDSISRGELAAIVRRELDRERALAPAEAAPVASRPTADEARERLSAEQHEHASRATQVIGGAVGRGRWTENDKAALWSSLEGLPAPLLDEITGQLAVAVNSGQLRLETEPPL